MSRTFSRQKIIFDDYFYNGSWSRFQITRGCQLQPASCHSSRLDKNLGHLKMFTTSKFSYDYNPADWSVWCCFSIALWYIINVSNVQNIQSAENLFLVTIFMMGVGRDFRPHEIASSSSQHDKVTTARINIAENLKFFTISKFSCAYNLADWNM